MDENMDTGFEEFFGAYDDGEGNQTEPESEAEESGEAGGNAEQEPAEGSADAGGDGQESGETAGKDTDEEAEKVTAETEDWLAQAISEQKFQIKVDKEARTVDFRDAPALLQKGVAFDRVKGQLETSRETAQDLQAQLDEQAPVFEFLKAAAEESSVTVEELVRTLQMNLLTSKGMTEAEAKEKLRADGLERQLRRVQEKQTQAQTAETDRQERMRADLAEFRKVFPDVALTPELVAKLKPDVQAGMSMTSAYLKMENARLAAEAAEARRQAEVAAQNKKNKTKTPGSQKDSGGQRTKDSFDDFFSAFEK